MRSRLILASFLGVAAAISVGIRLHATSSLAADFTWPLHGARLLLAGSNPYQAQLSPLPYEPNDPLFYPLPTVLAAVPFVFFSDPVAAGLFVGLTVGLMVYALTRNGWWRLWLLASAPFCVALSYAQWSPLVTAAAALPALLPLTVLKPNIGLPVLLAWPTRRGVLGCAVILALSLLVLPTWPHDWLANLARTHHPIPLLSLPGALLPLALLRARRPEARLLLGLALMPQHLLTYDLLPLLLIPRTWRGALALTAAGWIGLLSGMVLLPVLGIYGRDWLIAWNYLSGTVVLWPLREELAPGHTDSSATQSSPLSTPAAS